jgi:hypothetical protein
MSPAGSGQPRRCRASTGLPQPRGRPMVEGKCNVSHASTKYWVDVILATSWQCQRFDSESDALAYGQVYARLPNAEAVVAYAYRPVRSLRRRQHHRYAGGRAPLASSCAVYVPRGTAICPDGRGSGSKDCCPTLETGSRRVAASASARFSRRAYHAHRGGSRRRR